MPFVKFTGKSRKRRGRYRPNRNVLTAYRRLRGEGGIKVKPSLVRKVERREVSFGKKPSNPYSVASSIVDDALMVFASTEAQDLALEAANEVAKEIRRVINQQVLGWIPLNPRYLMWKKRHNLSTKILKATGWYAKKIGVWQELGRGGRKQVVVGVKGPHPVWGIKLGLLARWLEYGTRFMPARPHWRPVFRRFMKILRERKPQLTLSVREILESRIREEFR